LAERKVLAAYTNAVHLIRTNLETIQSGGRARAVAIGTLTDVQRDAINAHRLGHNPNLQPIVSEVVFVGSHIHRRRIVSDGYTIEDVIAQIVSAMAHDAEFRGGIPMQTISSIHPRTDRLGNRAVKDQAVFECTARRPSAELYSVIPKGDRIKPTK
jgi:hypothetical protein